jgi:hypothetical protein
VLGKHGSSDPRTRFYEKFKEEVAEHDEDLQKKYDEDLNTTLVFVSFFPPTESQCLTHCEVRSVFSNIRRVHPGHTVGTQTGLRTTEQYAPRASPQCYRWKYPSRTGSHSTAMAWPRSFRSSSPSRTLCGPLCHITRRFPGYAWETVARPVRADRNPRISC